MTWLIYAAWLSLAYASGRFVEVTWQAWAIAAIVGLGPVGQLALTSSDAPIGGSAGGDAVSTPYIVLAGAIGLGVAFFLCLLGRSQRSGD